MICLLFLIKNIKKKLKSKMILFEEPKNLVIWNESKKDFISKNNFS